MVRASKRLDSLSGYPFAEIDRLVDKLREEGIKPIDFGVGDPTDPTPQFIREALKIAVDKHASSGYPSYIGSEEYRTAISEWFYKRFGVRLDPNTEITANIGAKEAVFNLPHALLDPGDIVLCPSPGYPPYNRGTIFAGGTPYYYPICAENQFLPDLSMIPTSVLNRTRILWINYPNSPTGKVAPEEMYFEIRRYAEKWGFIIASDEAYSELYFEKKPHSILEFFREGVVVIQSLSKRSNMTGYRVGFVCGDEKIISLFKKLKTNIDSGTATFIQEAAIAALGDEAHVEEMRNRYRTKRDYLVDALRAIGCDVFVPEATIYVWARAPEGMTGLEFAKRLLSPNIGVVTTPGSALGEPLADGKNPGEGYVRFALVPSIDEVREAVDRIKRYFFK